jgi:hypothetical protein
MFHACIEDLEFMTVLSVPLSYIWETKRKEREKENRTS